MNRKDFSRDACMLTGSFARQGYDWWWHSFTGRHMVTGEEKTFFLEFFLCNPALGGAGPILGQLPENQAAGKKPSYVMIKGGCWGKEKCQLHRFFGWQEAQVSMSVPFRVSAGDCLLTETESHGSIYVTDAADNPAWMCDNGSMSWDLHIDKQVAFHVGYGAGKLFRTLKAFEMYWHAQGMKSQYSGTVTLNGEQYAIIPETSCGYADKNWGRNFTSPWVWLSSCDLTSRLTGKKLQNSVFDIGGGRPKVFFWALNRKLLSDLWYEGADYEFNFSKFWTLCRTEFSCSETDTEIQWHVDQRTRRHRMVTDVTCQKRDMLLVNYEAPDGTRRHSRLWNGGTGVGIIRLYQRHGQMQELVDELQAQHVGCEYGEYTL